MSRKYIISGDTLETESQVLGKYFIGYPEYCELQLMDPDTEDNICYRCGKHLEPLTYIEPEYYYTPCWDCTGLGNRKTERETSIESIQRALREYYNKILGDRYYQLFIVDDIYYKTTFPHTYTTFKKVISMLVPPSRNDIWFLDWYPGYPKIISPENIEGLRIVNLSDKYKDIVYDKEIITLGEYTIKFPEFIPFDYHHHSRYSILNKNGDRKSKRLKLGTRCLKFYNTEDLETRSIFKLYKNGDEVLMRDLSYQDFVILKLVLMRNKPFLRLVFDILEELGKTVGTIRDTIFLKNTVVINPKIDTTATLVWTSLSKNKSGNINISIF